MINSIVLRRDEDHDGGWPLPDDLPSVVADIERRLGFEFPEAYRNFLVAYNGGSFLECVFEGSDLGPVVVVNFFPAVTDDSVTVEEATLNMRDCLPPLSVAVADDPGGNVFYIAAGSGEVCFWDHGTREMTRLAGSFLEFAMSLVEE